MSRRTELDDLDKDRYIQHLLRSSFEFNRRVNCINCEGRGSARISTKDGYKYYECFKCRHTDKYKIKEEEMNLYRTKAEPKEVMPLPVHARGPLGNLRFSIKNWLNRQEYCKNYGTGRYAEYGFGATQEGNLIIPIFQAVDKSRNYIIRFGAGDDKKYKTYSNEGHAINMLLPYDRYASDNFYKARDFIVITEDTMSAFTVAQYFLCPVVSLQATHTSPENYNKILEFIQGCRAEGYNITKVFVILDPDKYGKLGAPKVIESLSHNGNHMGVNEYVNFTNFPSYDKEPKYMRKSALKMLMKGHIQHAQF